LYGYGVRMFVVAGVPESDDVVNLGNPGSELTQ
jgi:hypothetical protein